MAGVAWHRKPVAGVAVRLSNKAIHNSGPPQVLLGERRDRHACLASWPQHLHACVDGAPRSGGLDLTNDGGRDEVAPSECYCEAPFCNLSARHLVRVSSTIGRLYENAHTASQHGHERSRVASATKAVL